MIPKTALAGLALVSLGLAVAGPPRDTLPSKLPRTAPFGLPAVAAIGDEDDAVAELGRRLFFDPILSADETVACSSCHDPAHGFADPAPRSTGAYGRETLLHAPTLMNRAYGERFMWDGRFATLEEQVLAPIDNELEMALPLGEAVARLTADGDYARRFEETFGEPPGVERLADALAAFVRRLWRGDSAVDRFHAGRFSSLDDEERAGLWMFESRGKCWRCHSGQNFSDEDFHNTGVGWNGTDLHPGRAAVTGDDRDLGAFKTPTLRGLVDTAPYMHDGSMATLEEVVEFYRDGGRENPHLDERMAPIEMTDRDAANLVAFLRALSRTPEGPPPASDG